MKYVNLFPITIPKSRTATAVRAGYKDGKLCAVDFKTASFAAGNTIITFDENFSRADTYKVFLFDGIEKIIPLDNAKAGSVD